MATRTPSRDAEEGIHGESEHKPASYNDDFSQIINSQYSPDEQSKLSEAARSGDPDFESRQDLREREENPDNGSESKVGSSEESFVNNFNEKATGLGAAGAAISASPLGKVASIFFKNRRRGAATGLATLTLGGGVLLFSIFQGPLQFVHFAQLLQKFHLSRNEDLGDGRGAKLMLYALAGSAERGRLGEGTNKLADIWENRMVKKSGLRPLYNSSTGRLVGYEIVSNKKDRFDALQEVLDKNPDLRESFEKVAENGGEIRSRDEALARGSLRGTNSRTGLGKIIDQGHFVIDFRDVTEKGYRQTRIFTKSVGKVIVGPGIASSVGSRILIKRAGIPFHFFNNLKKKVDARADARERQRQNEEYEKSIFKRWSTAVKAGIIKGSGKNKESRELIADVEEQTEGKSASESRTLRTAAAKAAGPAAVVGIICGVKSLGSDAEAAKYANNYLPMMRMGMGVVTMGNQGMSGDSINLDEMGVMNKLLYDEETRTSWPSARSIQAELGQRQTGPDVPNEAKLGNIGNKGDLFEVVDFISGLGVGPISIGGACSLIDTIAGLPGMSAINSVIQAAIDAPLGLAGTSTEELMGNLIGAINGQSVNALAKGAEFGNLANVGTFLAANDQAIGTGGAGLESHEVVELKEYQSQLERAERAQKPLLARYFDPYDYASLSGQLIDNAPASATSVAIMANPLELLGSGLGGLFSSFSPKAHAAQNYNYGVKTYGFSLTDQEDDRFEIPDENAKIVEPQLAELNDKYGKCFGMTVDESWKLHNDKTVNVFKLEKDAEYKDCRDDKNKEIYKRYRFYLADSVTAKSLLCFEGDEEACREISGATSSAGDTQDQPIQGEGSAKIAAVAEQEYAKNGNKALETCGENCGPEVQKYTGGPSGPDAPWCAWFVSWVYREAGYEFKGAPAGADGNIPYVGNLVLWFKQHGIHFTPDSTQYKPEPGDVVMYGGDTHTGIVVKVNGDNIETVEGNTSGDGSFNANGETVGRKSYNYKTYSSRSIEFGRLKSF